MAKTDLTDRELEGISAAANAQRKRLKPCVRSIYDNISDVIAAIRGAVFGFSTPPSPEEYYKHVNTPPLDKYNNHLALEVWLKAHEPALNDTLNPDRWLRALKQEFGVDLRPTAFEYTLKDEYEKLLSHYGDRLESILTEIVQKCIAKLDPHLQEILYTYLLEPTHTDVENGILRHYIAQDALNAHITQVCGKDAEPKTTDGKSIPSIAHKVYGDDPKETRLYKQMDKLITALNKKLGAYEFINEKRWGLEGITFWDALNHLCYLQTGHGLVRPWYINAMRDGARGAILPETAHAFRSILKDLEQPSEGSAIVPEWICKLFPNVSARGIFSNGIEVRDSGLVFATTMIPFRDVETVVAEVQIMSPNMWVAKHWENSIYKAKSDIQNDKTASVEQKREAIEALTRLGLAYYLTAINADARIEDAGWKEFYVQAFKDAGAGYTLTENNGVFTAIQTPEGRVDFKPAQLSQLPEDGKLKDDHPPAFFQSLKEEVRNAMQPFLHQDGDHNLIKAAIEELGEHRGEQVE